MGIQVQLATKDGKGEPLSIFSRQFISFKYGSKRIEDFGLIAVFKGDRLEKEIYAPFSDITTQQSEIDGQLFWQTNFNANSLTFTLATDGMTSVQLEDFKEWFQPGIEKELILKEHHNRAIMARVSAPPQISLLPFEEKVFVEGIETSISLYKGEIVLSFVMDDPYWFSKLEWVEKVNKETAKLILEDKLPTEKSFNQKNCYLPNKKYFKKEENSPYQQLYYCGTAKEYPLIYFNILPVLDNDSKKISFNKTGSNQYYYLQVGTKRFSFSLPDIFSFYNLALDIASSYKEGSSVLDLKADLRDKILNSYARNFIIARVEEMRKNKVGILSDIIQDSFYQNFKIYLENFLINKSFTFSIDCKKGSVVISGEVNSYDGLKYSATKITENAGNIVKSEYLYLEKDEDQCLLAVTTNIDLNDLIIDYKYKYL